MHTGTPSTMVTAICMSWKIIKMAKAYLPAAWCLRARQQLVGGFAMIYKLLHWNNRSETQSLTYLWMIQDNCSLICDDNLSTVPLQVWNLFRKDTSIMKTGCGHTKPPAQWWHEYRNYAWSSLIHCELVHIHCDTNDVHLQITLARNTGRLLEFWVCKGRFKSINYNRIENNCSRNSLWWYFAQWRTVCF